MTPPAATKKPVVNKAAPTRPPIKDSSLVYLPEDVLDGFQERLEKCVTWTLLGGALRCHQEQARNPDLPKLTFSQALENKIKKSFMGTFFDKNSKMSIQEQWNHYLPLILYDVKFFEDEEEQICFKSDNIITDHCLEFLKHESFMITDRNVLWNDFYKRNTLRVIHAKITKLDNTITKFHNLTTLNLCGNFIEDLNPLLFPQQLLFLELGCNKIKSVANWVEHLPLNLLYLGLSKNFLTNESLDDFDRMPLNVTNLDLSDNDICDLKLAVTSLSKAKGISSLALSGNPCAMCAGYARLVLSTLRKLKWLDSRQILYTDRVFEEIEVHPDDLLSTWFYFSVFRVMSVLPPPKTEKGITTSYKIEVEFPLLDSYRRQFLFFHQFEALNEYLPEPEDMSPCDTLKESSESKSLSKVSGEGTIVESCVYDHMQPKNPRLIRNYTTFESNSVQWAKLMLFQDPIVKIFCPDMKALRDLFRSVIRVKLVYSMIPGKEQTNAATKKKSSHIAQGNRPALVEQTVDIFNITCSLKNVDWSQPYQHFFWDETLGTNEATHWGEGDLSVLQYPAVLVKPTKGKGDGESATNLKQTMPECLTCHLGFSIDMLPPVDV